MNLFSFLCYEAVFSFLYRVLCWVSMRSLRLGTNSRFRDATHKFGTPCFYYVSMATNRKMPVVSPQRSTFFFLFCGLNNNSIACVGLGVNTFVLRAGWLWLDVQGFGITSSLTCHKHAIGTNLHRIMDLFSLVLSKFFFLINWARCKNYNGNL